MTVLIGASEQFSASVAASPNATFTWDIVEASGCGSVSATGDYTAPATVPSPAFCHVRATSDGKLTGQATVSVANMASSGTPGVWTQLTIPVGAFENDAADTAGGAQTVVVDPVRPSDFYAFVSPADSQTTAVLKSTDFGVNWVDMNHTAALQGTPWGAAIDPNPNRDPNTPPTLYCPAGFGAYGVWKSTDGGSTWTNLLSGSSVFDPYNPYGKVDAYAITVAPDNPPNHVLFTYHYGFGPTTAPQTADGGFGESTDGGATWTVHPPPKGIGNSHYLVALDASTWVVIAQDNSGANGIWKTTTAGRVSGAVSTSAWKNVDTLEHPHGSFQAYVDPAVGTMYFPGRGGIKRSDDHGDTWKFVQTNSGYTSSIAASAKYFYSSFREGPTLLRADRSDDMTWASYGDTPATLLGPPPLGTALSYDGQHWIMVMGGGLSGLWRYVEP